MMVLSKNDVGKNFYLVEPVTIDGRPICIIYYGVFTGMMPKPNYKDSFADEYKREEVYLFRVRSERNYYVAKTTGNAGAIYESFEKAHNACWRNCLLDYSVMLKDIEEEV